MIAEIGKIFVVLGASLLLLGSLLWLSARTLRHIPLGRLPGDILVQNEYFTFYFPLTTGILLSLGLSVLLWLGKFITSR
ncbi:DUF2905 domain-containing protein [Synechococcus sp. PCC 6716]|nr:DUF2905 domain-containing protein [Synechococcus sp. PCC 6716]